MKSERAYRHQLLQAYDVCFPKGVRVSVETQAAHGGRFSWTPTTAASAALSLSSAPVIDRCLHRGEQGRTCVPHLICDCTRPGTITSIPAGVADLVKEGGKLDQREKALLALLKSAPERVLWSVAYAANRCAEQGFSRACVLLCFEASGVGHANMIFVEASRDQLAVTVYEPNGQEAAERYDTVRRFFPHFARRLQPLLRSGADVSLEVAGVALQTLLGSETTRRGRGLMTVSRRGYPVCAAVVLWFFSLVATSDAAVPDVEAALLGLGRRRLKRELLEWVRELASWVREAYADVMRAQLEAVFDDSNVRSVAIKYGAAVAAF